MAADEYRRHAAECLHIADGIINPENKMLLIAMAQAWLRLAQQGEKNLTTALVYETPPQQYAHSVMQQQQQQIDLKKE